MYAEMLWGASGEVRGKRTGARNEKNIRVD